MAFLFHKHLPSPSPQKVLVGNAIFVKHLPTHHLDLCYRRRSLLFLFFRRADSLLSSRVGQWWGSLLATQHSFRQSFLLFVENWATLSPRWQRWGQTQWAGGIQLKLGAESNRFRVGHSNTQILAVYQEGASYDGYCHVLTNQNPLPSPSRALMSFRRIVSSSPTGGSVRRDSSDQVPLPKQYLKGLRKLPAHILPLPPVTAKG